MRYTPSRCVREKGLRKPSQQGTREKPLYSHLRTCTQPTQPFAAGVKPAAHSQPALRTGLMALLGVLGVILFDFRYSVHFALVPIPQGPLSAVAIPVKPLFMSWIPHGKGDQPVED